MAVVLITDASNEVGGLDGAKIIKILNKVIRNASTDYRYIPASSVLTTMMIGGPGSTVTA